MEKSKMEISYDWILRCIETSSDIFQFRCCKTIVGLFETMYKEEDTGKQLIAQLKEALDWHEIKHSVDA